VRIFGRTAVPADVLARADLPPGERVLASGAADDGTWVLGTRRLLVFVPRAPEEGRSPVSKGPSEEVESAAGRVPEERREERAARLEGPLRLPWESVEDASWDRDGEELRVTGIGDYGRPRPTYALAMAEPADLLQLVRERVTASIVLQRRVAVRGRLGLTVIGRRSPAGGPISWMHAYDEGLDPADPQVATVADAALAHARSEVGEPM
jgi:hypothetical protein